jgi:hypothetical protein
MQDVYLVNEAGETCLMKWRNSGNHSAKEWWLGIDDLNAAGQPIMFAQAKLQVKDIAGDKRFSRPKPKPFLG